MRLHNAWRYSGFPPEEIERGIASGEIRAFTLRSEYHRKLVGERQRIVLVNVESLDRFIEKHEQLAARGGAE
jgi:hypothetical protein